MLCKQMDPTTFEINAKTDFCLSQSTAQAQEQGGTQTEGWKVFSVLSIDKIWATQKQPWTLIKL